MSAPRLVVAGVSSGVGKTTTTVGLISALKQRGLKVAAFKCGPDYLDPTYLSRAAGLPSQNLDGWMMGREAVLSTFLAASAQADVSLIEGVMGLFDGASATSDEGSTAQIAKWLDAPVLLVVDASGMARSIAALAKGFTELDPRLRVAGVACNRVGSPGHLSLLRQALQEPPIWGGLQKRPGLAFSERHLGLRAADSSAVPPEQLAAWGAEVEAGFDLGAVLSAARSAPSLEARASADEPTRPARCQIGIAHDDAFHFYYADNLRRLERLGAKLVYFSPLADERLPAVDGLYIGGGYPELYAERLASHQAMRASIRSFAESGGPVYAECGGLMYLAEAIRTVTGEKHAMVGLIPGQAVVQERLMALGYVEVTTTATSVLGPAGLSFRGHQFRYSELSGAPGGATSVYRLRRRRGGEEQQEGFRVGSVLATYVHAHWSSNPAIAEYFVRACDDYRNNVRG